MYERITTKWTERENNAMKKSDEKRKMTACDACSTAPEHPKTEADNDYAAGNGTFHSQRPSANPRAVSSSTFSLRFAT